MIKAFSIQDYYYVTSVENHSSIKNHLLQAIDRLPVTSYDNEYEKLSNQDWDLDPNIYREYRDIFFNMVRPYMGSLSTQLGYSQWIIHNVWFQQYNNQDLHSWHNHETANFSNVYFVELPHGELVTEIFNPITKTIIKLEGVKEGDILTFPAHYIHRAPKNLTEDRKTIIAFNSSFTGVNIKA